MIGTLYPLKMKYERRYKEYLENKQMALGPSLFSRLETRDVVLQVPQAWYDTGIWRFWFDKDFKWDKVEKVFTLIITGKPYPERWLERAIIRFNQLWYGEPT